jgi:hypothetical protein
LRPSRLALYLHEPRGSNFTDDADNLTCGGLSVWRYAVTEPE